HDAQVVPRLPQRSIELRRLLEAGGRLLIALCAAELQCSQSRVEIAQALASDNLRAAVVLGFVRILWARVSPRTTTTPWNQHEHGPHGCKDHAAPPVSQPAIPTHGARP